MISIDIAALSPLERAAIEYVAETEPREMGADTLTVEAYLLALVERAMNEWKERFITAKLPELRPLATRFLSLDAEGQAAILARLTELDEGQPAEATETEDA